MHTRLLLRYAPQSGSARRYFDRTTGQMISRRTFLALHGIQPERQAFVRRASGIIPRRKRRCDAGQRRALVWSEARRVPLSSHHAVIVPFASVSSRLLARCFQVLIDHLAVVRAYLLPGLGNRRGRWCCADCRQVVRNKAALMHHVLYEHFYTVCGQHGPTIQPIVYVPARERRARMPWRLSAPELEL